MIKFGLVSVISDQFGPKIEIWIGSANMDHSGSCFRLEETRKICSKIQGTQNIPYSVKILVNADIPFLSKESR